METVIGLVALAALVGIVILFGKAKDAASKALAQKVIYKKKFEQGKHILKGFTFETTVSSSAVMQQLEKRVVVADTPSGLTARLYVALRKPNRIDYVYGHKFGDSFRVAVVLESRGSGTLGVLKPVSWHESEGIIVAQEWLGKLLDQVRAAVREVDPNASFVEGVHDSVQLTVPAAKAVPESDAWPEPEPEHEPEPAQVAPAAVATAVPAAPPALYSGDVTPIVPPTKANATWQWVGIVLVVGAMLWLTLGVQVSILPVWFAVLAGGGAILYFADRAARKGRAPAIASDAASASAAPSRDAAALAEEAPEPTLAERLATDESEPDPYAWAEPKVATPGSAPVTLNSVAGGFKNIVIGVALLGVGGWSLLSGEFDIIPSLFALGGGVYFLASRSLEGKVAVFVHRLADVAAGRLLAGAVAVSGRLDSAGKSVKPVVLARVVLAVVLILGLGYGIKGLSGVGDVVMSYSGDGTVSTSTTSGSPFAWIALLLGITPLWVWPALEKRVAQGATSPAPPVRRTQPENAEAAKRPATRSAEQALPDERVFGTSGDEDDAAEARTLTDPPGPEPSAEEFELAAEELSAAAEPAAVAIPAIATPSSKLVPRIVVGIAALMIVGIVGAGFLSQIRKPEAAVEADSEPSAQQTSDSADEPYDPLAGAMSVDALTGDTKARSELELFSSAPADGSTEFADVVYADGGQQMGEIYLEFALVSRDPGEWYIAVFDEGAGFYIDYEPVEPPEFYGAVDSATNGEFARGMIVFDNEAVYELHVFTQGQKASASTPEKDQVTVVPDLLALDLPYAEWEDLEYGEALKAHDAAVEAAFREAGLVASIEREYYTGGDGMPIQSPPAGAVVPVGTVVSITIFTVD